jgi:hypothetical protein
LGESAWSYWCEDRYEIRLRMQVAWNSLFVRARGSWRIGGGEEGRRGEREKNGGGSERQRVWVGGEGAKREEARGAERSGWTGLRQMCVS